MDMNQWILSKDMAKWISRRQPLPVSDEINCILSAPHRSLKEKLEGLKLLGKKHTGLADQVLWMESLVEWAYMDTGTEDTHDLYETEIFCRGVRDEFMEKKIFQNAISARESVRGNRSHKFGSRSSTDVCLWYPAAVQAVFWQI